MIIQIPTTHNIIHLSEIMSDALKVYGQGEKIVSELDGPVRDYTGCCAHWLLLTQSVNKKT